MWKSYAHASPAIKCDSRLAGFLARRIRNEQSEITISNFHVTKIEELCCPRSAAVSVTCPRYLYTYAGRKKWTGVFSILAAGGILVRVFAIEVTEPAGAAHGFPVCAISMGISLLTVNSGNGWREISFMSSSVTISMMVSGLRKKRCFVSIQNSFRKVGRGRSSKMGSCHASLLLTFREKRLLRCYAGITRRNSSRRTWKSNRDGPLLDLALPHVDLSARRGSSDLLGAAPCLEQSRMVSLGVQDTGSSILKKFAMARAFITPRGRGTRAPVRPVRLRSGQDFLSEQAVRPARYRS